MKIAYKTDKGLSRDINEDSLIHFKLGPCMELLIVADGMGGYNAGEVASKIAVESIKNYIVEKQEYLKTIEDKENIISEAIAKANDDIIHQSLNDSHYTGMGTTVIAALASDNFAYIGHVGDSRAYIMQNGVLERITNDHSLVAELVKNGTITEAEAQHHPQKNIITRALGTNSKVQADIQKVKLCPGDILLLCTDGLTNLVDDNEIERILKEYSDPSVAAQKLVLRANGLGGYDNISVIIACAESQDCEVKK